MADYSGYGQLAGEVFRPRLISWLPSTKWIPGLTSSASSLSSYAPLYNIIGGRGNVPASGGGNAAYPGTRQQRNERKNLSLPVPSSDSGCGPSDDEPTRPSAPFQNTPRRALAAPTKYSASKSARTRKTPYILRQPMHTSTPIKDKVSYWPNPPVNASCKDVYGPSENDGNSSYTFYNAGDDRLENWKSLSAILGSNPNLYNPPASDEPSILPRYRPRDLRFACSTPKKIPCPKTVSFAPCPLPKPAAAECPVAQSSAPQPPSCHTPKATTAACCPSTPKKGPKPTPTSSDASACAYEEPLAWPLDDSVKPPRKHHKRRKKKTRSEQRHKTKKAPYSSNTQPANPHREETKCPNVTNEGQSICSLKQLPKVSDVGLLGRFMKKITGAPPKNDYPCPLKKKFSKKAVAMHDKRQCFSGRNKKDENFMMLDDLWNPNYFMRWKCIDNWDQHKESLWRQQIQWKIDCPDVRNRGIQEMMDDAFRAMNSPDGQCVAFRMIYGILKRNEDLYMNTYIDSFTDEQFVSLIVALNRFYHEDKDKRKIFFDHPPPSFIEKIMMKETLAIIDQTSPTTVIARRFWELLLDWYAAKVWSMQQKDDEQEDAEAECLDGDDYY